MHTLLGLALVATACGGGEAPASTLRVDLHVMPTCPFARAELSALTPVLEGLGERVEFHLHHLGEIAGRDVRMVYGEADLTRAALQVCAAELGGERGQRRWLACEVRHDLDGEGLPTLDEVEACSAEAGVEMAALTACAEGARGAELLHASVAESRAAGIEGSPTLELAGERHAGGRSTEALARALCAKLPPPAAPYCLSLPAPAKVAVTIVADPACSAPDCGTSRFVHYVQAELPGAAIRTLDSSEPEARALTARTGAHYLPFALFDGALAAEPAVLRTLERAELRPVDGGGYFLALGAHHQVPSDSSLAPTDVEVP